MTNHCMFLLFTFLQCVLSYHQFYSTPSRDLGHHNDPEEYINFDNFDITRRRGGRQVPQYDGFEWEEPSRPSQNNFNRPSSRLTNDWNRPDRQTDNFGDFVFEDDFESRSNALRTTERNTWRNTNEWTPTRRPIRTSTVAVSVPGMGTPRSACENRCLTTPEYNPVCGDDGMTYFSKSRLMCAQTCGKRVKMKHLGACTRIRPQRG